MAYDHRYKAYSLWKLGFDTKRISDTLSIPEPLVLKLISERRSMDLGVASPYERQPRAGNPKGRLTAKDIVGIFGDARPQKEIASAYSVSRSLVCKIKSGKIWAHLCLPSESTDGPPITPDGKVAHY